MKTNKPVLIKCMSVSGLCALMLLVSGCQTLDGDTYSFSLKKDDPQLLIEDITQDYRGQRETDRITSDRMEQEYEQQIEHKTDSESVDAMP